MAKDVLNYERSITGQVEDLHFNPFYFDSPKISYIVQILLKVKKEQKIND
uniref:Uncharacterized protein n=1 Tax=Tetranychus urticae TaxID=32264 RepID=T1KAY9_TETUR